MKNFLLKKVGAILGLIILLMIALEMISGVISERSRFRNDAKHNIAQSWTGKQNVIGPILVVPYEERISRSTWDKKLKKEIIKIEKVCREIYLMPENLNIDANADTELRYRGMYAVPVYSTQMSFDGKFTNQKILEKAGNNQNIVKWGVPYLVVNIGDTRGIPSRPEVLWGDNTIKFNSGSNVKGMSQGMHALLPQLMLDGEKDYQFSFKLNLRGMESLSFSPVGINTLVKLQSDWPHPGFNGRYLPEQRDISESGFSATWRVSSFSSNVGQQLDQCKKGNCKSLMNNYFGVALVQPIDIYHQTERSIKYAVLFISLFFIAFMVFEIVKQLRIHPVQYLLVGMALAIFYLLLVSLSEHIAFHWAYLTAAVSCSGLLGFYLTGVLHSFRQGLLFSVMIAILYGVLFVILRSEDAALLMGSILLFTTLALLMMITRHIDWYGLNSESSSEDKSLNL